MKKLKKIINVFRNFNKTINLLWITNPIKFCAILSIGLISGFLVPLELSIWKYVVDEIAKVISGDAYIYTVILYLIYFFAAELVIVLLNNISSYLQNTYSVEFNINITNKILDKLSKVELCKFDQADTYNIIQKSQEETLQRSMSLLQTVVEAVKNIANLSGTIGILLLFDPVITFSTVLSAIPMFYISCAVMNKWYEIFNKRFEGNRFVKKLQEIVISNNNIKEIKLYSSFNFIKSRINSILGDYLNEDKKIRKKFMLENISIKSIDEIILYVIKGMVIFLAVQRAMTIGMITMYLSSVDNTKSCISNLLTIIANAYENCLYLQNIFQLFELEEEIDDGECVKDGIEKIEFVDVSFRYPDATEYALEHISITFEKNKTYALVGINGSGKTTLIKLLLGLYKPQEGKILINGKDMNLYNKKEIYRHCSAVFQDYIKYPFDIKTNIGLGCEKDINNIERIKKAAKMSGADEFIEKLPEKYNTQLRKEWSNSVEISIGQWQKIAIARGIMKDASVMILDEPTASLDAIAEYEIIKSFEKIKNNSLCILVTHRLNSIKLADLIVVMNLGKIVELGSHTELYNQHGEYYNLYSKQAEAYLQE